VNELQSKFTVSQRRACRVVGQPRQTQRYHRKVRDDEPALVEDILKLVGEFPRYGYRFICGKLRQLGWTINPKRVYRIWKQEGLKVPMKKRKKRRLGNSDNSAQRAAAEHANHVWSWDFVFDRTASGKQLKWLVIIDEFTRENLCLEVGYGFKSEDVIDRLVAISSIRGLPRFIRSDNGPEFIAEALRKWLAKLDVGTLYIEPGSPWQNAFVESFNSRFRDEFLSLEVFDNREAAQRLTRLWRTNYNDHRPHSSLGYLPPTEFARQCSASVACAPSAEHCRKDQKINAEFNQPVLS
jgi:transposase InsO family protein